MTEDHPSPERVQVRCPSWEHFEQLFRQRRGRERVFVVRRSSPPPGTRVEVCFGAPDGTTIAAPGRVLSIVTPEEGARAGRRPGMLVQLSELPEDERERVGALLQRLAEQREAGGEWESQIADEEADLTLERLQTELFALQHADDHAVLGLEATADEDAVRSAYLELSRRYRPSRYRSLGSAEVQRVAGEILATIERAYARLRSGGPEAPPAAAPSEPTAPPLRTETDLAVSEALTLLEAQQYAKAQQKLTLALTARPDRVDAKIWLLVAFARQAKSAGDLQQAFESYRAVLELDPNHAEAGTQLTELAAGAMPASMLRRVLGRKS